MNPATSRWILTHFWFHVVGLAYSALCWLFTMICAVIIYEQSRAWPSAEVYSRRDFRLLIKHTFVTFAILGVVFAWCCLHKVYGQRVMTWIHERGIVSLRLPASAPPVKCETDVDRAIRMLQTRLSWRIMLSASLGWAVAAWGIFYPGFVTLLHYTVQGTLGLLYGILIHQQILALWRLKDSPRELKTWIEAEVKRSSAT
jgi:hypothetical protein